MNSKDDSAAARFLASMPMTQEMWHDGTGYDLDALRQVPAEERAGVEEVLIQHAPRDWRDIEALAEIDSPRARKVIVEALNDPDPAVRREAQRHVGEEEIDPAVREANLLKLLAERPCAHLTEALDEAEAFHPPAVIEALIRGALNGDGTSAVHFAAMVYYLHGKAAEPFDWGQRPFFLRFNTADRGEREAAFGEMCRTIGVEATRYLKA
jgi:hypothetical protein